MSPSAAEATEPPGRRRGPAGPDRGDNRRTASSLSIINIATDAAGLDEVPIPATAPPSRAPPDHREIQKEGKEAKKGMFLFSSISRTNNGRTNLRTDN